ncbi:hypothetical protein [Mesorhizobium dulcispinae]|nr:hypothetical protein [Mesorhizobium sp. VK23D]MDX8521837.1 hypothetical protein [Mesorhizobium sp. VK23D]
MSSGDLIPAFGQGKGEHDQLVGLLRREGEPRLHIRFECRLDVHVNRHM